MEIFCTLLGENAHIVETFKSAHACRTHSDGFATMCYEFLDGLTSHSNVFGVHIVITNFFTFHRFEGACTYMESKFFTVNASLIKGIQNTFSEMKSCGGSCHGALDLRIDRLICRLITLLCLTIQIGGNGELAHSIKQFRPCVVTIPSELNDVGSAMQSLTFACQCHPLTIRHLYLTHQFTFLPLLQITHETVPLHHPLLRKIQLVVIRHSGFEAEHLNECSLHAIDRNFTEMKSSLNDFGVVEHHQGTTG